MDWETFYERFYDWSASTQINRISSLKTFGASSEVTEVAQEFADEKVASRFIRKAVAAGVQFTPEEIYDLSGCCDTATMNLLLESAKCRFTQEQLEALDGAVDDELLHKVAKRNRVVLFGCDDEVEMDGSVVEEEQPPKVGFFSALFGLGIGRHADKRYHKHDGKCDGDCANCPSHYGYRYGRWYYGHHHTEGCEFGGNGGV